MKVISIQLQQNIKKPYLIIVILNYINEITSNILNDMSLVILSSKIQEGSRVKLCMKQIHSQKNLICKMDALYPYIRLFI